MMTLPAILLSSLFPAAEPLSPDELRVAVAALEESRSRLKSFEVIYRHRQEVMPGVNNLGAQPAPGEFTFEWSWRSGRERFLATGEKHRGERWYDGSKTYIWYFNREDPSKLDRVWIHHWPPDAMNTNFDLALVTGFGGPYFEGGVPALVKNAIDRQTLSGEVTERGWELALGTHDVNGLNYEIMLVLDAQHDYRLVSWQIEEETTSRVQRYIVDEFQLVTDEADGSSIWYPLRAHMEQLVLTRLEVDSVRINLDLPDSRFVPPEMPFGIRVHEMMKPGELPKSYLVGGPDAEEQRLAALAAIARKERDRLDREGVTFDATPQTGFQLQSAKIALVGVLFLLVGGYLVWRRNRQVTSLPAR